MATGLYNLITAQITTMSANILTGSNGGNTKVELRFTNVPSGNTYTNTVDYPRMNFLTYEPVHTTFSGGFEPTSSATAPYSAGDTVQQLYAILSNSQVPITLLECKYHFFLQPQHKTKSIFQE
jgi:hypothetical protein